MSVVLRFKPQLRHVPQLSGGLVRFLASKGGLPQVTEFSQFEQMRKNKEAFIIDVREPEELTEHGSIPGTVNIPLGDLQEFFALGDKEFHSRTGFPKPKSEYPIVTFCRIGQRSATAQQLLQDKLGFDNVSNYLGSFTEWNKKATK
ncbi:hypothetical protein TCAL_05578 [Tigriopus californicus]|uniref:Rhodanese domain-containing protein n=1 Tax=Tigriopus californicus TaxID=6832 RepID=A0A553NF10_TIGCA|nr:uncharacterized protein LOC131889448 [Tigriopus californicus]TRY64020.1 hypothetical protein TCAL_05578 [Tigriopus californicus]|eukprot:TCALIF_05578-PA protein Name:"Similar to SPAC4H3.07c Putative thiosulfate sulfurtransferase, mitochondrial (Schizosaccharomyces pombe (strain 972 / ATCC 24843))" AED:0.44 eAED:0.44 QI:0/-1/0/1/-1/1/1/0/145